MDYIVVSNQTLAASIRQFLIDTNAPVKVTLSGAGVYSTNSCADTKLKSILGEIGKCFEEDHPSAFAVYCHTVQTKSLTEKEIKSKTETKIILELLNLLISEYKFLESAKEILKLEIETTVDRGFLIGKKQAWSLNVSLTTEGLEKAEKAGLKFRKYTTQVPLGTLYAQPLYPGQGLS